MNTIIIATNNKHKKEKLLWIVKDFFIPGYMTENIDIEENGDSFEKNAKIKASAIAKHFKSFAIATDGGALIPSLGNKWDSLLTKRFIGKKEVSDWDRIEALLLLMKDKKGDDRKIVWKEAIAIADPEGKIIYSCEVDGDTGLIQESYKKSQYREGIWLCTLWSYPQFGNRNFFELNEEETKEGEISWWKLRGKTRQYLENIK